MIILASSSPRRIELLKTLYNDFKIIKPTFDESLISKDDKDLALKESYEKGKSILNPTYFNDLIISADTIVRLNNKVYGKPKDKNEAITFLKELSKKEQKALKMANFTFFALIALVAVLTIPQNGMLRNAETGSIIDHSPLMNGVVPILTIIFLVPSIVYGKVAGVFNNEKDVCASLENAMKSMGAYIALSFVAAQFVNYFSYTNLGTILALKGAELLQSLNVSPIILMILFVLFTGFINLFMGSASAKWAILAPVFLPMFMKVGISPELTQVAYRIGDSTTNIISPLMSYFAMIVVFAQKYDKKAGIGTIISTMVPYSVIFLIGWSILLAIWMVTGLPLGPGVSLTM